jgi:endonuclease YncB( thermonuclease family)
MTKAWHAPIFALLLVFSAIGPAFTQQEIVGIASVIDGDTIAIHGQRIRLFGIDAPESSQLCVRPNGERCRCGQHSSFALADRIGRATVNCQPRDRDPYDRVVAVCFKGTEDLDRWTVANGWAVAYRRYSLDYIVDEGAARRNRLNIWSGGFDMPWDWRAATEPIM